MPRQGRAASCPDLATSAGREAGKQADNLQGYFGIRPALQLPVGTCTQLTPFPENPAPSKSQGHQRNIFYRRCKNNTLTMIVEGAIDFRVQ